MAELELTRAQADRRLYELQGVGTLRLEGWTSRAATAEAGPMSWALRRRGALKPTVQATDAARTVVGEFEAGSWRRGGHLSWAGAKYELRPASRWRERYALANGDRELALLDGKGWGKRPVKVIMEDPAVAPGLLLFAAFVVRGLAEDAGAAASAAT